MLKNMFKKTALLAALCSAGLGAHADGINFSALIDAGVSSTTISGGTAAQNGTTTEFMTGALGPNLMHLGWSKTQDGLTAGIDFEQGFSLSPGDTNTTGSVGGFSYNNTGLFNREASVSLKGDFGTVKIGTQINPALLALVGLDPRGVSNTGSALLPYLTMGGPLFDEGSISYTNKSGPIGYELMYVMPNQNSSGTSGLNTGTPKGSGYRANLMYESGSLGAGIGLYSDQNNNYNKAAASNLDQGVTLGVNYKFDKLKVFMIGLTQLTNAKYNAAGAVVNGNGKLNTTGIGATYDFSNKTNLMFGIYNSLDPNSVNKTNVQMMSGTLTYAVLKDVKLYGSYTNITEGNTNSTLGYVLSGSAGTLANNGGGLVSGEKANIINIGLQYAF
jgi:hypothetical protein